MFDWDCDFGVLTVVPEAWEAALELFGIERFREELGLTWGVGLLEAMDGGHHIVVVGQTSDRSNIPANETASALLRAWKPRHLVLADIGGGFWGEGPKDRDGLDVGDVVVASDIEYFEVEKQVPGGKAIPRGYSLLPPSVGPRTALRTLHNSSPKWYESAQAKRPAKGGPSRAPQILDGQIVAGEKLLSDPASSLVKRLVKKYDKALGLDMESAGVSRAVHERQREGIYSELTVLRGISDLFDKNEANQQKRDGWKPYAAHVAVAAARAWIVGSRSDRGIIASGRPLPQAISALQGSIEPPATQRAPEPADVFLEKVRAWLKSAAPIADRSFRLALEATAHRSAPTAAPESGTAVERGELLDLVLHDRKVVIVGRSGAGKSNLLRQVLRQAAAQDEPIPVYIDLKERWRSDWAVGLVELPTTEAEVNQSMEAFLTATDMNLTASELAEISARRKVVLIVDALNEVPAFTTKIRRLLDQYPRFHSNVLVLVGDRRAGDFYPESQWTVLDLGGVPEYEAADVIDDNFGEGQFAALNGHDRKLLCLPFFLDRALESGRIHLGSRANAVNDFLERAGLGEHQITSIALAAFDAYKRGEIGLNDSNIELLEEMNALGRLRDAAILIDGANGPVFSHQLVHQFLAGRYLGSRSEEWTSQTLDDVTADSASLDTVGMTIASIPEQEERDRFLRIVYDWNWRAAVRALIEAQTGDSNVSDALATALLALAAEKRFDPVAGTRRRVEGLLKDVPGEIAERMRAVSDTQELLDQVALIEFPEADWWASWRDVFLWRPEHLTLSDREVVLVGSSEPLIGWTVANSMRRFPASEGVAVPLHIIHRSQRRHEPGACATRWRVVHALGKWPTQSNAEFLLETLDDSYSWAVYGAVRSLIEMAALAGAGDLRTWILEQLANRWPELSPESLSQIPWPAAYRGADASWPSTVRPLLDSIRNSQAGGERERWDRRLEAFDQYASDHSVSK